MLQSQVGHVLLLGATQTFFVERSEFLRDERNYTNIEMLCCGGGTVGLTHHVDTHKDLTAHGPSSWFLQTLC